MNQTLITGTDNFRKLVSSDGISVDPNRLFVDKTLLIKDFLDASGETILITRPRRWGKTLNMSMLQHFFADTVDGKPTAGLFKNLNISKEPEYMAQQGQSPVIFVSFKDLKGDSFEEIKSDIAGIIAELFRKHQYILNALISRDPRFKYETEVGYQTEQNIFEDILKQKATNTDLRDSLSFLSRLLAEFHRKNCYIFVDEYDNAINNAFSKDKQLLEQLTTFFGGLFGKAFKGNTYLKKGLITGILRVAKANIFSGLNNPREYTVLDERFNQHYGFTETEIASLLKQLKFTQSTEIKEWYNGYRIATRTLYNPWSIMSCLDESGKFEPYWVDTANPTLIREILLNRSTIQIKQKLRELIQGKSVTLSQPLEKYISTEDIYNNPESLWTFLLHTGYLTLASNSDTQTVRLPNLEVTEVIRKQVTHWFNQNRQMNQAANCLLLGDIIGFLDALKQELSDPSYAARLFSSGGKSSKNLATFAMKEFVYQFLLMTHLKCINDGSDQYHVVAEPYIGFGQSRADFLVINEQQKLCIIGELKVSANRSKLAHDAEHNALAQIQTKGYGKEHEASGYQLICLGLAFKGIDFAAAYTLPGSEQVHLFSLS